MNGTDAPTMLLIRTGRSTKWPGVVDTWVSGGSLGEKRGDI